MKRFAYPLAILAVVAASLPAGAQQQLQFQTQDLMSPLQNAENVPSAPLVKETKQLRALSKFEVKRAFGLAAKERGRQAIEISCAPADSDWCANDFVAACDKNDGGMSTNPDGGVTCSLPQYE